MEEDFIVDWRHDSSFTYPGVHNFIESREFFSDVTNIN